MRPTRLTWKYALPALPSLSPQIQLRFRVVPGFARNPPELRDRFVKSAPGFRALGFGDGFFPSPPELRDRFDAPKRAGPRCPNRLAADQHIDRIGVKLGKLTQ